ncbi:MAG: flagellar basal body-associated FliL family protein [Burkholderiales bacterium]|nr:flagellar basal body-associated FliL family protein [Burkholderiales bacterium]
MAEAKKPAPQAAEPADGASKSKKNTLLYVVIIFLLVVVLAVGGFAAWLFFTVSASQSYGDTATSEDASGDKNGDKASKSSKEKKKESKKIADEPPVFEKLDTFTVNLVGGTVLQTEIYVQLSNEKQKDTIKAYLPLLSSQVNLLLGSKKPEEIATLEGKQKLMTDVKQVINKALGAKDDEDGVLSVQFKSFIVQ